MIKCKRLLAAALLLGSVFLFTTQSPREALAQQPQCWNQSTNRLSDIVPGSITGGSWHSNDHSSDRHAHGRTVHRDGWSGARVEGFPVC